MPKQSEGLQWPVFPGAPVTPGGPGMPGMPCWPIGPGRPTLPYPGGPWMPRETEQGEGGTFHKTHQAPMDVVFF